MPQQILHEWNSIAHVAEHKGAPRRRPLTYDEVQALFDAADSLPGKIRGSGRKGALAAQRDAAVIKTIYAFGLRRREVWSLDLADLWHNPKAPAFKRFGALYVRWAKASGRGHRFEGQRDCDRWRCPTRMKMALVPNLTVEDPTAFLTAAQAAKGRACSATGPASSPSDPKIWHALPHDQQNRVHRSPVTTSCGPKTPGPRKTLLAYALELSERHPDQPLPRDGYPFPDDLEHRRRGTIPQAPEDPRRAGAAVSRILIRHFSQADPDPARLAEAVHHVHVPIYPRGHIKWAAREAGEDRALETGRWLIRNGTDRCAATVGLALLEAVGITNDDISLVQTIGLLSNHFGPLAARALEKVPGDATTALLWLADRVTGWGRVNVVASLASLDNPDARWWLLHKAVDGDFLNAEFITHVVRGGRLHEAVEDCETDPELTDCVGRILGVMTESEGMGLTLRGYEHVVPVLAAHHRAISRQGPTLQRYRLAVSIARYLGRTAVSDPASSSGWEAARSAYRGLLDQADWHQVALTGMADGDRGMRWIADSIAPELGLALADE